MYGCTCTCIIVLMKCYALLNWKVIKQPLDDYLILTKQQTSGIEVTSFRVGLNIFCCVGNSMY